MAKTFEYSMKIPFDMSDVNGFIKIPQLILLSLQVSGMQSIELGMSDMYILENYNLVWIITDYNMKIERLPVFDEKITIETYAKSHNRLFCYRAFNIKDEAGNTISKNHNKNKSGYKMGCGHKRTLVLYAYL